MTKNDRKTVWATFIGIPNAGKSTLLNSVVGSKVSIVTHKAQTTRTTLKGIVTEGDTQIVIIDTPGIFQTKGSKVGRIMVDCAWNSLDDVDEIFLILDCTKVTKQDNIQLIESIKKRKVNCNLVLNKIDLIKKENLLQIAQELNEKIDFKNTFMVSATKSLGLKGVIEFLKKNALTPGWFFDEDDITTAPLRFMASEIVREKLFKYTHEELPYNLEVETEKWEEKDKVVVISMLVFVRNKSHKGIVIGKGGELLKKIGTRSREDLEKLLDKKVYLNIHIKVDNWEKKVISKGFQQF